MLTGQQFTVHVHIHNICSLTKYNRLTRRLFYMTRMSVFGHVTIHKETNKALNSNQGQHHNFQIPFTNPIGFCPTIGISLVWVRWLATHIKTLTMELASETYDYLKNLTRLSASHLIEYRLHSARLIS